MKLADVFQKDHFTPYSPSRWFLEELYKLDPEAPGMLRVRWSQERQMWALERKQRAKIQYVNWLPQFKLRYPNGKNNPPKYIQNDSWLRARDGYVLIGFYTPEALRFPEWVLKDIQAHDMRRLGGWEAIDKKINEEERAADEKRDKAAAQERYDFSVDFYNSEQWRQGERAAVPRNYEG